MKIACITIIVVVLLTAVASGQIAPSPIKGFTEPYRSIDVAASEAGTISFIAVAEGDQVGVDMILARLNEDVLRASLAIASADKQATGKLNLALAELHLQQQRLRKLTGLFERQHASQTEIDRAQTQLDIARAQLESVRDELCLKAMEINRVEAQLEQRRLRSPINGVVNRIFKDVGEFVSANDPVVVNVVQLDPLLVMFSVPQNQARYLEEQQNIRLALGEDQDQVDGFIEFVSPTADAQSGTCRVKIRIDNPDQKWPSGVVCYLDSSTIAATATAPVSVRSSNLVDGNQSSSWTQ